MGLGGGARAMHELADALGHVVSDKGNGGARTSGNSGSSGGRDPAERGKKRALLPGSPSFTSGSSSPFLLGIRILSFFSLS